jgi:regulator of protease activity HflC (stomatin/prohibitin superfamily)
MDDLIGLLIVLVVPIIFAAVLVSTALRILPEYERAVVFRLGRFMGVYGPGMFFIIPLVDRMVRVEIPSQWYITRDRVKVRVGAVAHYQVVDPERAIVNVEDYCQAILEAVQINLGSVIGQRELDQLLAQRDTVNDQLWAVTNGQAEPRGIKVGRVEVKEVELA